MAENWRFVANGIFTGIQFREELDEENAAGVAKFILERPLVGLDRDQQYAALVEAVERGHDLTLLDRNAHSEDSYRAFLAMIVSQLDALRPWPELPFETVYLERWDEFPAPVVSGRLELRRMKVEQALRDTLQRFADTRQSGIVLRLPSGALVAIIVRWWPDSHHCAVITNASNDADQVLRELLEATQLPGDKLTRLQ